MPLATEIARLGRPVDLPPLESDGSGQICLPRLLLGLGRGAQATIAHAQPSFWLCLAGTIHVTSPQGAMVLQAGQWLLNTEARLRLASIGESQWLGLAFAPGTLEGLLGSTPILLAAVDDAPGPWLEAGRQALSEAARESLSADGAASLIGILAEWDRETRDRIARCPGRSEKARLLSYARLLRARNRIFAAPSDIDGISTLATLSNYSAWHFSRVFHRAFGETPMEYALRLRLDRARLQVESTQTAIAQIARESGFETFSAFCRSFRERFGAPASRIRFRRTAGAHARQKVNSP